MVINRRSNYSLDNTLSAISIVADGTCHNLPQLTTTCCLNVLLVLEDGRRIDDVDSIDRQVPAFERLLYFQIEPIG